MNHKGVQNAILISAVRSICPITWCTRSNIAFACGFLTVVGLRFIQYESHRCSKCNLNSLPLSYIKYLQCGYLHNQVLFTRRAMRSELLSNVSSFMSNSLPLTFVVRCLSTTGSSTISNQLEAGSIMVRAMKSICEPSLPLRVYGPMRLTHKASQRILITVFAGRCPYLSFRFLFVWQVLQDC